MGIEASLNNLNKMMHKNMKLLELICQSTIEKPSIADVVKIKEKIKDIVDD